MSTTTGTTAILKYPDYCIYCTKKFNSEPCLLPYSVVKNVILPDDYSEQVMFLTELHCQYNTGALNHIADVGRYHSSNPSSYDDSPYHRNITRAFTAGMPATHQHDAPTPTDASGAPLYSEHNTEYEPTAPETHRTEETVEPSVAHPTTEPPSESKPISLAKLEKAPSPLTQANLESHTSPKSRQPTMPQLPLKQVLHLVQDLHLALVTAQNLRKKRRTTLTAADLSSSLSTEIETKSRLGIQYSPASSTKLDHPIALARELIATHNDSLVLEWLSSPPTDTVSQCDCFLCPSLDLFPSYTREAPTRLDNYLLFFCRRSIKILDHQEDHKKQAKDALKHLLAERNMQTSLDWLQTAKLSELYLSDEILIKLEASLLPNPRLKQKEANPPLAESEPPLTDVSQQALKTDVPKLLAFMRSTHTDSIEQLSTEKFNDATLIRITEDLFRYHPNWRLTTSSFPASMVKATLMRLSIPTTAMEQVLLSSFYTELLGLLRPKRS